MRAFNRTLLVVALLLAAPHSLVAQDNAGDVVADAAFSASVLAFVEITRSAPEPPSGVDRLLYFQRDDNGEVFLSGLAMVSAADAAPRQDGAQAVARLRYDLPRSATVPAAADGRIVTENGVSSFVYDVSRKRYWEVGRIAGNLMYRQIDKRGVPGEWQPLPAG